MSRTGLRTKDISWSNSFQVYNLSQNIQEDDLQHLQVYTPFLPILMNTFVGVFENNIKAMTNIVFSPSA